MDISAIQQLSETLRGIVLADIAAGREFGVQFCVYYKGKNIIDIAEGILDTETREPVDSSSLFPVFSSSKGIAATVIHRLAARGLIDYDAPLSAYWPEIARNGKQAMTMRHVLTHTSGLHHVPNNLTTEQLADWDWVCNMLCDMAPLSPPGEKYGYHAISYSWLVAEPAQRITGRPFVQLIKEEIADVINEPDLFMGVPADFDRTIATLYHPDDDDLPPTGEYAGIPACGFPVHAFMNTDLGRQSCLPSSSGVMSARALARHYAALLPHGAEGMRLLGDERLAQALIPHPVGNRAMGWTFIGESRAMFGHTGYGGSVGAALPKYDITFGFTKNRYSDDKLIRALLGTIAQTAGIADML